jgi:hypothetical protein
MRASVKYRLPRGDRGIVTMAKIDITPVSKMMKMLVKNARALPMARRYCHNAHPQQQQVFPAKTL